MIKPLGAICDSLNLKMEIRFSELDTGLLQSKFGVGDRSAVTKSKTVLKTQTHYQKADVKSGTHPSLQDWLLKLCKPFYHLLDYFNLPKLKIFS